MRSPMPDMETIEKRAASAVRNKLLGWALHICDNDIPALLAHIGELEAALGPFAALEAAITEAESHHGALGFEDAVWTFKGVKLLRGNLRRAAELVPPKAGGEGEKDDAIRP